VEEGNGCLFPERAGHWGNSGQERRRFITMDFFFLPLESYSLITKNQLLDAMEDDVSKGGCILDWHACDLFPERWVDLVVVLRTDSTVLYDRLKTR
jgi:hypothetical protein